MKSPVRHLLLAAATLVAASSVNAATALKSGTVGTTELSGTPLNTWTGGGAANGSPATGDIVTWNATSLVGSQTISNDVTWNSMTFSGLTGALNIGGTGVITFNGGSSGSLALVSNNSTGTTVTISNTINATYGAGATVPVGTGGTNRIQFTGDQGTLILTGNVTANGAGTTSDGDVNLWLRGANTSNRIDGTLIVDGQLAKGDTGTWTLSGTNTIGWVYTNNGTLLAGSDQAFGTGTIYLANNNNANNVTLASSSATNRAYSNALDISATVVGTGTTANFSAGNGFSVIFGQTGTGTQSFSGGVDLGTLVRQLTTNTDTTFSNTVTGTGGGIFKLGTAKLILSGANNYTGATTVSAGTLQFVKEVSLYNNTTASWTAANLTVASGATAAFNVGGTGEFTSSDIDTLMSLTNVASGVTATAGFKNGSFLGLDTTNAGGSFTYGSAITNHVAGATTDTLGLVKLGTGSLVLTGANTYTGGTNIAAGTLALSGGDNRLATTGTVNFTGAGTLDVGSTSQTLANLTVANNITGTVTGTGALTVNGSAMTIGGGTVNNVTQTLDLSGLDAFAYNNAAGTFQVGKTITTNQSSLGVVTLATNNTITASILNIGNAYFSGVAGTLHLGQSNVINANTITVGANAGGLVDMRGLANSTVSIHDATGGNTANIIVGQNGAGSDFTATMNLSGATVDISVNSLTVGLANRGSLSSPARTFAGIFTMDAGLFQANTVTLGQVISGTDGYTTSGTFNLNGGTAKIATLSLVDKVSTTGYATSGTFNLSGGAILQAGLIQPGTSGANGTKTRTFTWTDGTIKNYDATTDLTISSGLSSFNVTGAGTHAFDISAGRTGTVNQVISGSGALTKLGSGKLVLNGNSGAFSGGITITAGTLATGHTNALGSGNITVNGGTLSISDTSVGQVTLGAGAMLAMNSGKLTIDITNGTTFDKVVGNGTAHFSLTGGTLELAGVAGFEGTGGVGSTYSLFSGFAGTGNSTTGLTISGYDTNNWLASLNAATGTLAFTAVPEPSEYGLIGAGALAAFAMVRRRRKLAGKAA